MAVLAEQQHIIIIISAILYMYMVFYIIRQRGKERAGLHIGWEWRGAVHKHGDHQVIYLDLAQESKKK